MAIERSEAEADWDQDIEDIHVTLGKLHDAYGDDVLYAALVEYPHRYLVQDLREDALSSTDGSKTGDGE